MYNIAHLVQQKSLELIEKLLDNSSNEEILSMIDVHEPIPNKIEEQQIVYACYVNDYDYDEWLLSLHSTKKGAYQAGHNWLYIENVFTFEERLIYGRTDYNLKLPHKFRIKPFTVYE